MPGDELTDRDRAIDGPRAPAGTPGQASATARPNGAQAAPASIPETQAGPAAAPPGVRVARLRLRRPRGPAGRWLSIFAASFGLFLIRFLVPVPVGQADNRDGPRLMCGLGVGPVTHGYPRYFRYAYFE